MDEASPRVNRSAEGDDGAVRDAGEIRQFKIPVFVRGVNHGAAHWRELVPVEHAHASDPLRRLHRDDGRLDRVR